jgi:hypothetical protein
MSPKSICVIAPSWVARYAIVMPVVTATLHLRAYEACHEPERWSG